MGFGGGVGLLRFLGSMLMVYNRDRAPTVYNSLFCAWSENAEEGGDMALISLWFKNRGGTHSHEKSNIRYNMLMNI